MSKSGSWNNHLFTYTPYKDIFEIFSPFGSQAILVFPYQTGQRYSNGNSPNGGVECKGGIKIDDFRPISRCISETVIVRWAHAARQEREFDAYKLFISIKFSFHPYNIQRDCPQASPGETKMWAVVRENCAFFALAVRITGKLLKIDGYMLRGVWQALNCLFIHATFCVIATGSSPRQTKKMKAWVRKNDDILAIVVRITGKLLQIDS